MRLSSRVELEQNYQQRSAAGEGSSPQSSEGFGDTYGIGQSLDACTVRRLNLVARKQRHTATMAAGEPPPQYNFAQKYYRVRHNPLEVAGIELRGNVRTKDSLIRKVLAPVSWAVLDKIV